MPFLTRILPYGACFAGHAKAKRYRLVIKNGNKNYMNATASRKEVEPVPHLELPQIQVF